MTAPPDQNETSPHPHLLCSIPKSSIPASQKENKKKDDLQFSHQHAVAHKTEYEMALGHVLTGHPLLYKGDSSSGNICQVGLVKKA